MLPATQSASIILTVGHSTRTLDEFIALLQSHGVLTIADVRQYPRSRRFPHFNDDALAQSLPAAGIDYVSFRSLGGRRRPAPDSPNRGWRNEAFRGYADFMQTRAFQAALEELINVAQDRRTAIMCAEAVPWRCHRSLIADALAVRGWRVLDIVNAGTPKEHALPDFARVTGHSIVYPAPDEDLFPP